MGVLTTNYPTLVDIARAQDPNGKIAVMAEILNAYNEILDDLPFAEANMGSMHKTTLRAKIPAPTWRLLNYGVQPVKSTNNQIIDSCGMLEAYSEIDKSLADLNGNAPAFRLSEDKAIIEGIGQELASTIIYGDTSVNPEKFVGLAPRYYGITSTNGGTTYPNVIDGGGTGSVNTSIWLVGWSPETIHGIFPKGSKGGLSVMDKGQVTLWDSQTPPGKYEGYQTHFKQDAGLVVRDWRFVVRIANIDTTALATAGDGNDTSANLIKLMSLALDKFPPIGNVRPVFYCNQLVRGLLRVKMASKSNVWLDLNKDMMSASGFPRPTLTFMGYPVRRVDAILNTEAALT